MNVLKEIDTPLLSRKRITLELSFEGATPSKVNLIKELVKKYKVDEKLIEIRHIYTKYGDRKAKAIVHIYTDAAQMKDIVKLGKKAIEKIAKKEEEAKKKAEDKAKAAEEAKAAAAAEKEAPAEEAKPEGE